MARKSAFYRECKINFSFCGKARSPFFLNVNPENFRIASISFFPGRGIRVRAARTLHGAWYTVGMRIVHSHVIIHRSPSLRFRPLLREVARFLLPREFCSSISRQTGYCRIPFRDLSRLRSFRN